MACPNYEFSKVIFANPTYYSSFDQGYVADSVIIAETNRK